MKDIFSNTISLIKEILPENYEIRIESQQDVNSFLKDTKEYLNNKAHLYCEVLNCSKDQDFKEVKNAYSLSSIFPDDNPIRALKRHLKGLKQESYICTIKDMHFLKKSEIRVFCLALQKKNFYLQIRNEKILNNHTIYISLKFSNSEFEKNIFPYRRALEP